MVNSDVHVYCDLEIWVRAKSGARIRCRGRLELAALLDLTDANAGEVVKKILFKAGREIAEAYEQDEKQWEDARRRKNL